MHYAFIENAKKKKRNKTFESLVFSFEWNQKAKKIVVLMFHIICNEGRNAKIQMKIKIDFDHIFAVMRFHRSNKLEN